MRADNEPQNSENSLSQEAGTVPNGDGPNGDGPNGEGSKGEASKDAERLGVRVVAFGGGTGMASLLSGLNERVEEITAVVTVTDNGGSSGRLRNDFDIVPPGDIRNCLLSLSDVSPLVEEAFQYRFSEGEFKGHCFGNLFITVLTRVTGSFEESIRQLHSILNVRGKVLPISGEKISLVAHHPDGSKSTGEVQITKSGKPIQQIELRPSPVLLSSEVSEAIEKADYFVFGPGSLYTSVIPHLLVDGIMEAIKKSGKPRIYVGNIMTQPGETVGYSLSDHLSALRLHGGEDFPDCVIAHQGPLPPEMLKKYARRGAAPVVNDLGEHDEFSDVDVIEQNFFVGGDFAKHHSEVLGEVVASCFKVTH